VPVAIGPEDRLAFAQPDQSRADGCEDRNPAPCDVGLARHHQLDGARGPAGFVEEGDRCVDRDNVRIDLAGPMQPGPSDFFQQQGADLWKIVLDPKGEVGKAIGFAFEHMDRWPLGRVSVGHI